MALSNSTESDLEYNNPVMLILHIVKCFYFQENKLFITKAWLQFLQCITLHSDLVMRNCAKQNENSNQKQGSILAVVRSSETTKKSYERVSKITNSSGGRVSFKGQFFFFNFSRVNVPAFWMSTSHSVIPYSKFRFIVHMTSYVVLSDVKYLQAQFFVLNAEVLQ